ncbi:MAG: GntP family permease [Planctomycetia bacterium]|nr:GntP family permease [Planctomycetia bacterium]
MDPLLILLIGLAVVIGLIIILRLNPFLALLAAALTVSFLAAPAPGTEGNWGAQVSRVGVALGEMAGKIIILISMGALIGQAMTRSGAADRIIQVIVGRFGQKRMPAALMSSGFLLSIPVFYDATFYLLLPLVRAVYRMTQKHYILYLLAIGFGATLSHTLVPPTPGPLMVAKEMDISIGAMMLISGMVGICTIPFALLIAKTLDRLMPNPIIADETIRESLKPLPTGTGENVNRENMDLTQNGEITENEFSSEPSSGTQVSETPSGSTPTFTRLPSFGMSILPIILPVVLIAGAAITQTLTDNGTIQWTETTHVWHQIIALAGDAQVALMLSALTALTVLLFTQKLSLREMEKEVGIALQSAGTIILITSAGGAFGAMLRTCGVGERIQELVLSGNGTFTGLGVLLLAFATASMIKTAQGSSTTAMITTAGIFSTLGLEAATLGFHPGYAAVAIGVGSCVTGWMNDSGFCIFASMSGLSETTVLKCWTVGLALMGVVGLIVTMILSQLIPLV